MKLEDSVRLNKLYDAYGALLTDVQQEIAEAYIFDDLTISEIADNKRISRQAVKDSLTKTSKKLEEYDSKLNFIAKYEALLGKKKKGAQ